MIFQIQILLFHDFRIYLYQNNKPQKNINKKYMNKQSQETNYFQKNEEMKKILSFKQQEILTQKSIIELKKQDEIKMQQEICHAKNSYQIKLKGELQLKQKIIDQLEISIKDQEAQMRKLADEIKIITQSTESFQKKQKEELAKLQKLNFQQILPKINENNQLRVPHLLDVENILISNCLDLIRQLKKLDQINI